MESTKSDTKKDRPVDSSVGLPTAALAAVIVLIIIIGVILWPTIVKMLHGHVGSGSGSRLQSTTTELSASSEQSAEIGASAAVSSGVVEKFRAPAKPSYVRDLTSRTWNALITTYRVPGAVTKYDQVSGTATFSQENGESVVLELTWLSDSHRYDFTNWRLNSSMDGFTMDYNDEKKGYILYASIEKRSASRYDISIFDEENNIKRLIIATA